MDDNFEEYEPTQEEWEKIEDLIYKEEMEEEKEYKQFKRVAIGSFKIWCKENGIIW